jgi:hypothetical protein
MRPDPKGVRPPAGNLGQTSARRWSTLAWLLAASIMGGQQRPESGGRLGLLCESAMDDQLKQQLMPAVVVFNLTLVLYFAVRVLYPMLVMNKRIMMGQFTTHLMVGAGIGLVTGGIALAITMMRKK